MRKKWRNNTIICVDDESSVRDTYQRVLGPKKDDSISKILELAASRGSGSTVQQTKKKDRYRVLLAPSGEEALRLVEKEKKKGNKVVAGFFDMRMPGGMDGYETIRKARQLDDDLICCVVTAYTDREVEEIRSIFTEDHQDELLYIKKPFTVNELEQAALNMVSAWNNKRKLEDHVKAIEKQRKGLHQILHAIGTFLNVPPPSLDYLIPGLLLQFLGIVEGKNGFSAVCSNSRMDKKLSFGVGAYQDGDDFDQIMGTSPDFDQAFGDNRTIVNHGRCSIPFMSNKQIFGGMYIESDSSIFDFLDIEALEIFRSQMVNLLLNSIYHKEMVEKEAESITDPLTGLYNRRFISMRMKEEVSRSRRNQKPLSMLMIDIDNFKDINDSFGHGYGDHVLQTIATIVRRKVRDYDLIIEKDKVAGEEEQFAIRYGGEEFSLFLLDCDEFNAQAIADRLRSSIENHAFHNDENSLRVTASFGVYTQNEWDGAESPEEILRMLCKKSDEALYEAKTMGKNRVVVYAPGGELEVCA